MDTRYNAASTSQIHDQQHLTISEVMDNWHELMVLNAV